MDLFHITDFLPTFAHLAGFSLPNDIDGVNQWEVISQGTPTERQEILHVTDPIFGFSSYMKGKFKLVNGTTSDGKFDKWLGHIDEIPLDANEYSQKIFSSLVNEIASKYDSQISQDVINDLRRQSTLSCKVVATPDIDRNFSCNPLEKPCLFNIQIDPCELSDLSETHPGILKNLLENLDKHIEKSVEPRNKPKDPNCDPANFNFTWNWWLTAREEL